MFRTRFWMLAGVVAAVIGPLVATAGYGLYLRSGLYSDRIAARASRFLGAPVRIERVVPLDTGSRGFAGVAVWLPDEFQPIFSCEMAVLRRCDDRTAELELREGWVRACTDDWTKGTVASLLRTAFAHDFRKMKLRTVVLSDMDLALRRGKASLVAYDASGRIELADHGGRLDIVCEELNGMPAAEPIGISCRFQGGSPPLIEEAKVTVRRLAIEALLPWEVRAAASRARGGASTAPVRPEELSGGWFTGTIVYRQKDRQSLDGVVELSGELGGIDVGVLAARAGRKGFGGRATVYLDKAVIEGGRLRRLQGRLAVEDLDLSGPLALAGVKDPSGLASLEVHEVRYEDGVIQALLASGQVRDLEAAPLTRSWSGGSLTGRIEAELQKIRILDDRLDELAGQVRVVPPEGGGTIDRAVLETAMQQWLGLLLPPVLPERIGYTEMGAKFQGADDEMYVQGVAGPGEMFILVADMAPVTIPLLPQPAEPVALAPIQAMAAERLRPVRAAARQWLDGMLGGKR